MSNLFKFAENILNNLDHSTQSSIHSALNKPTENGTDNRTGLYFDEFKKYDTSYEQYKAKPDSSKKSVNKSKSKQQNQQKDDELIEFLNNGQLISTSTTPTKRLSPNINEISSTTHKSTDLTSLKYPFLSGNESVTSLSKANTDNENDESDIEHGQNKKKINFQIGSGAISAADNMSDNKEESGDEKQIFYENRQLKNEVFSLQNEIKSFLNRIKSNEEELNRSKRKIDHFQNQISECDKIIRELRAREDDLNESIKSKDTQLSILRVRYTEMEADLKEKKVELEQIRNQSERILRDHSNSSDLQSQAFETLKDKVSQLEFNLQRERDSYLNAQKETMAIQSKLETEKQELTSNINFIEKKLNDEKARVNELTNQIKILKQSNNNLRQELDDYKQKAAKILQSKDKLIASLKDGVANLNSFSADGAASASSANTNIENSSKINLNLIEIEELKSERDYLKEDIQSKNVTIELLRAEIQDLESQASNEIDSLKDQIRSFQDNYLDEKQKKDAFELDLRNLRQELVYTQEELYKQKANLNQRLQEREKEIEKLRNQLTAKSVGTTTEKELENRLHTLTESIIQKQAFIEALQSEKHSLFLQLERSEKRLQNYENIVSSRKSTILNLNDDEDFSTKSNFYFRESPYDHEVTRKVKRAVSKIDKFSIRLGVFLKRYPIARVFVIVYMILLHLWVLIVLFTYKPEIHNVDYYQAALPKPQPNMI